MKNLTDHIFKYLGDFVGTPVHVFSLSGENKNLETFRSE